MADEAEVKLENVQRFLHAATDVVLSTKDNKGTPYYTTKRHYQKTASNWSKFLSGAARRVK